MIKVNKCCDQLHLVTIKEGTQFLPAGISNKGYIVFLIVNESGYEALHQVSSTWKISPKELSDLLSNKVVRTARDPKDGVGGPDGFEIVLG